MAMPWEKDWSNNTPDGSIASTPPWEKDWSQPAKPSGAQTQMPWEKFGKQSGPTTPSGLTPMPDIKPEQLQPEIGKARTELQQAPTPEKQQRYQGLLKQKDEAISSKMALPAIEGLKEAGKGLGRGLLTAAVIPTKMTRGVAGLVNLPLAMGERALGVKDGIFGKAESFLAAPTEAEQIVSDINQTSIANTLKEGGIKAAVAQEVSQNIFSAFTETLATLGIAGAWSKPAQAITSGVTRIPGFLKASGQALKEAIPEALRFSAWTFATTPGDLPTRSKSAGASAAMMLAPAVTAGFPSPWLAKVASFAALSSVTTIPEIPEMMKQAEEWSKRTGGTVEQGLAVVMTPSVLMNLLFGASAHSIPDATRKQLVADAQKFNPVITKAMEDYASNQVPLRGTKPPAEIAPRGLVTEAGIARGRSILEALPPRPEGGAKPLAQQEAEFAKKQVNIQKARQVLAERKAKANEPVTPDELKKPLETLTNKAAENRAIVEEEARISSEEQKFKPQPTEGVTPAPKEAPTAGSEPSVAGAISDWTTGQERPFKFDPNSTKNEGRFRLAPPISVDPNFFDKGAYTIGGKPTDFIRRDKFSGVEFPDGIQAVVGKVKGQEQIQAIRFDKGKFTEQQAAAWYAQNAEHLGRQPAKETFDASIEQSAMGVSGREQAGTTAQMAEGKPGKLQQITAQEKEGQARPSEAITDKKEVTGETGIAEGRTTEAKSYGTSMLGERGTAERALQQPALSGETAQDVASSGTQAQINEKRTALKKEILRLQKEAKRLANSGNLKTSKEIREQQIPDLQAQLRQLPSKAVSKGEAYESRQKEKVAEGERTREERRIDLVKSSSRSTADGLTKTILEGNFRTEYPAIAKFVENGTVNPEDWTPEQWEQAAQIHEQAASLNTDVTFIKNDASGVGGAVLPFKGTNGRRIMLIADPLDGKHELFHIRVLEGDKDAIDAVDRAKAYIKIHAGLAKTYKASAELVLNMGMKPGQERITLPTDSIIEDMAADIDAGILDRFKSINLKKMSEDLKAIPKEKAVVGMESKPPPLAEAPVPSVEIAKPATGFGEDLQGTPATRGEPQSPAPSQALTAESRNTEATQPEKPSMDTPIKNAGKISEALQEYVNRRVKENPADIRTRELATQLGNEISAAVQNKDVLKLRNWLNGINPGLNKLFTAITGLPSKRQYEVNASLRSLNPEVWDKLAQEKPKKYEPVASKAVKVEATPEGKTISVPSKDTPSITPKEQKKYLLAEIDKAIEGATVSRPPKYGKGGRITDSLRTGEKKSKAAFEKRIAFHEEQAKQEGISLDDWYNKHEFNKDFVYPHIVIEVPGDGEFKLVNNKDSLYQFREKARLYFPDKEGKSRKDVLKKFETEEQMKAWQEGSGQRPESRVKVKPAEATPPAKEAISDFGEKVGGARKDVAERGFKRGGAPKEPETGEAWRKNYVAMEKVDGSGWTLGKTGDKYGISARREQTFATKEEAEKAIPLFAVAEKHRVYENRDGKTFSIFKNVSDRKRIRVVDKDFPSREEGMKYMAEHAKELLNQKISFGEEILPVPEIAIRKGAERRTADATPKMFMETFKPRAIEFGNWNNQEERQQVMNHAYDGLMDLADILRVSPKALMLNGDLAIAFGARGQGLSGAKAHYERDYGIINLTKMRGAGSLAHEWIHALDHYLARLDTKAPSEKVRNERGDLVYLKKASKYGLQSHGSSVKSKMRVELREKYETLVKSLYKKAEQYVEDTQVADKFLSKARERLQSSIDNARKALQRDNSSYNKTKFGKPAGAEQIAEFDKLANTLLEGGNLETKFVLNDPKRRMSFAGRYTNETLEAMSKIFKAVRNRTGFSTQFDEPLNDISSSMGTYRERMRLLDEAKTGVEKTKQVTTNYAIEAKKMDQARTGNYWSEPHEMTARAFASYVEDKIAKSGGQSDFLVYHAHGGILLPMIDGFIARPYPEGKEREIINNLFDSFVKEIKTTETEKGVAMYAANRNAGAIKSADPVTYDDQGNVIPLSERFNPEKQDIRFSVRRGMEPPEPEGIRKDDIDARRKLMNLPEYKTLREGHPEVLDAVLAKYQENAGVGRELIDKNADRKNVALNNEQMMTVAVETLQRSKEYNDKAKTYHNNPTPENRIEMDDAKRDYDQASLFSQEVGSATARGLEIRKAYLASDYTLARIEARAEAENEGKPLDEATREKFRDLTAKLQDAERVISEQKSVTSEEMATKDKTIENLYKEIDSLSAQIVALRKRPKIKEPIKIAEDLLAHEQEILDKIAKRKAGGARFAAKAGSEGTTEAPRKEKMTPEILGDYAEIGAIRIAKGMDKLSAWKKNMVDTFGDDIKPHIGQIWNKAKFIHSEGIKAEAGKEADAFKAAVQNKVIHVKTEAEKNQARIKQILAQRERVIKDLENRLATAKTGEIPKPKERKPIPEDKRIEEAKFKADDLRAQIEREVRNIRLAQRSLPDKVGDAFVKWERAFKLSSPVVFGKLFMAALTRGITTPIEEVIGSGYTAILPKAITSKAAREARLSIRAEANAIISAWTKGINDAGKTLTKGKSVLDLGHGRKYVLPPEASEFFGHLHAVMKAPVKRAEFERSLQKRIDSALRNNPRLDIKNELIMTQIMEKAYEDANRSIFLQDNFITDNYSNFVGMLENSKKYPKAGQWTARTLRFLLPIVKVPTNIVGETFTNVAGSVVGTVKLANAMRRGLENVTPEEADIIMRNFKKGTLGSGLLLMGFLNAQNIGGFYQEREKRKPGDVKAGKFRIMGEDVPSWMTHAPVWEVLQIGASINRIMHERIKKTGEEKGITDATLAAAMGLIKEVPFVDIAGRLSDSMKSDAKATYFFGELAKGTVSPQLVTKIANWTDQNEQGEKIKREPRTILEHVKTGFPGLIKQVPEKQEKRQGLLPKLDLPTLPKLETR